VRKSRTLVIAKMALATLFFAAFSTSDAQDLRVFYDVTTVKPHAPGDSKLDWRSSTDSFAANNVDLRSFIASAWDVRPDQVAGGPSWIGDEHWDMMGKVTEADPAAIQKLSKADVLSMQQKFLSDRFHLRIHLETRTNAVYDMVPIKGGIKLQPLGAGADGTLPKRLGISTRNSEDGGVTLLGRGVGISGLIRNVASNLHRTVIDKTGLPNDALFDFTLHFAPDAGMGASVQTDALPMREALEQQLGLHMESARGPVQVVVIDSIDKPTPN